MMCVLYHKLIDTWGRVSQHISYSFRKIFKEIRIDILTYLMLSCSWIAWNMTRKLYVLRSNHLFKILREQLLFKIFWSSSISGVEYYTHCKVWRFWQNFKCLTSHIFPLSNSVSITVKKMWKWALIHIFQIKS